MGKKGVLLDNGKSAQSSMALYWKKNRQQSKAPKKQYEPTEEQQLDQRAENGFAKWKLHKQKMIAKSYQKKEKTVQNVRINEQKAEEEEDYEYEKKQKESGPVNIPGFKSKQFLKQKLRPETKQEVSQKDNVLKLPSHMSHITEEDIQRILRQKKAKADMIKRKKQTDKEDVILGEDFLESFRQNKKEKTDEVPKVVQQIVPVQQKQEPFFKSDILNKISKGDLSVIAPPLEQTSNAAVIETQNQNKIAESIEEIQKQVFRPSFVPRSVAKKK